MSLNADISQLYFNCRKKPTLNKVLKFLDQDVSHPYKNKYSFFFIFQLRSFMFVSCRVTRQEHTVSSFSLRLLEDHLSFLHAIEFICISLTCLRLMPKDTAIKLCCYHYQLLTNAPSYQSDKFRVLQCRVSQ